MVETIECHECGTENDVVLGDLAIIHNSGMVSVHEVNMHGSVEIGRGTTLPDAPRDTADVIESGDR